MIKDQKKTGIVISYFNLIFNMIVNILLTPFLISYLSDANYSVYKIMQSLVGPLSIFNLGISTIVARSVVQYRMNENESKQRKQNVLALAMLVSVFMSLIIIAIGLYIYKSIPSMYGETFSLSQLELAKKMFLILLSSTILNILTDSFNGCVIGNEKFIVNSGTITLKNILRLSLIIICFKLHFDVVFITFVDLIVSIVVFCVLGSYSLFRLKEFPKLTYINKGEIITMFTFSLSIFLQAVVNQVNNNIDVVLLGAFVINKSVITMYSSALVIYSVYNSMVSVTTSFFLPQATKLVSTEASGKELTDFIIRPGRFQAMVAIAIIGGFFIFGKSFISIWIGNQYIDAYWIVLLLMVPVTIPLVENTAITILDAMMKRMYRSLVLFFMAIINVIISIILIRYLGFWGATLGTVFSLFIGHIVMMNIYYSKVLHIEVLRMFKDIFKGILLCGIITIIIFIPFSFTINTNYISFGIKILAFLIVYFTLLWFIGINSDEKKYIKQIIKKRNER